MKAPKQPAFQFYTGDWLKDPKLRKCEPATRGIWIDAIAAMHEDRRSGTLSGTPGQLSRVLGCSEAALMAAVDDLQATGAADVTKCRNIVTLVNRRMREETKLREENSLRKAKSRNKEPVTKKSHPYSSSSSSKDPPTPLGIESLFLIFWEAYPRKICQEDARVEFARLRPDKTILDTMLHALDVMRASTDWQKDAGKYVPYPAAWLKKRRWNDDLSAYIQADCSDPVYDEPGSEPALRLETGADGRRIAFKAK